MAMFTGLPLGIKKEGTVRIAVALFILTMILTHTCFGEIQVLKNKNTDEVIAISENMDIVSNALDDEIVELPHSLDYYNLTERWDLYILKNKKFKLNTEKITKIEDEKKQLNDKKEKKKVDQATAKIKLIDLGFTSDEADIILDIY